MREIDESVKAFDPHFGKILQLQKELIPEEEEDPKKIKSEIEGQR